MNRYFSGVRSAILFVCVALGCAQILAAGIFFIRFGSNGGTNQQSAIRGTNSRLAAPQHFAPQQPSFSRPLSHVYPYSIILGGVRSITELKDAVADDPVVAKHYEGFNLHAARVIRLNQQRSAYVSYRVGEKTFWTTRKLNLSAGEVLITDGEHTSRARCGNLISDIPKSPVFLGEPNASTFDTPLNLGDPAPPGDPPIQLVPGQSLYAADPSDRAFIPIIPVVLPLLPSDPGSTPSSPIPTPVPEPGTLILLSTGLSGIWLCRKIQNGSRQT